MKLRRSTHQGPYGHDVSAVKRFPMNKPCRPAAYFQHANQHVNQLVCKAFMQ